MAACQNCLKNREKKKNKHLSVLSCVDELSRWVSAEKSCSPTALWGFSIWSNNMHNATASHQGTPTRDCIVHIVIKPTRYPNNRYSILKQFVLWCLTVLKMKTQNIRLNHFKDAFLYSKWSKKSQKCCLERDLEGHLVQTSRWCKSIANTRSGQLWSS